MSAPRLFLFLMVLLPTALPAEPAPWYKWQSKLTQVVACAQASPGEAWERGLMAFRDSRCTQLR